ncbi:MAG TPA: hypothetical protein VN649_15735 [Ramlibacter sp.]|nr:hypothetical protein [Ramlibacter sp.]
MDIPVVSTVSHEAARSVVSEKNNAASHIGEAAFVSLSRRDSPLRRFSSA